MMGMLGQGGPMGCGTGGMGMLRPMMPQQMPGAPQPQGQQVQPQPQQQVPQQQQQQPPAPGGPLTAAVLATAPTGVQKQVTTPPSVLYIVLPRASYMTEKQMLCAGEYNL